MQSLYWAQKKYHSYLCKAGFIEKRSGCEWKGASSNLVRQKISYVFGIGFACDKKGAVVNGKGVSRPDFFVSNCGGKRYSAYKMP